MQSELLRYPVKNEGPPTRPFTAGELMEAIGVKYTGGNVDVGSLPFSPDDATAGSESEMQTVVLGNHSDVDLPLTIETSNYLANMRRRAKSGDTPVKIMTNLETYLSDNSEGVWENSWVRLPVHTLGRYARQILQTDLSADKNDPDKGQRTDIDRFLYRQNGEDYLRIPVSYLLKLSLAEMIGSPKLSHSNISATGFKLMDHFLNDNTSPETSSFFVVSASSKESLGQNLAEETAIRYLLGQILLMYANDKFSLKRGGQEALMFFSPHPPVKQKALSNCISDSFYRELFMNPCLSGWDDGQKKYEYMHLCHRVLSRSQFNAALKLREAGIITSNLVSLPNLSNISLANNGTHVSIGSRKMSSLLGNPSSAYTRHHEKYLGDLVVKIAEHFLPLFVGTYTAAPYRMDFTDFHPEKALGFLPHELDYTHLRMLWRRWRKKADLKVLGNPVTPFGPTLLDNIVSFVFCLKGDFIPDFRLIDYLVAILSTETSPALNGKINNSRPLKQDLADLGVFDTKMSLYLFEKLREYDVMGFTGFESRHYSLFESFNRDMSQAVNLQNLVYLLAFKYIAKGQIRHEHIPDEPFIESERRQIIFGGAIGIPTFFVRRNTGNALLKTILEKANKVRSSGRYAGYMRVYQHEYRLALLRVIREDAADLIEMLNLNEMICDLEDRITSPSHFAASGRLTRGILQSVNAISPMDISADTFNRGAENFYRTSLRQMHLGESLEILRDAMQRMDRNAPALDQSTRTWMQTLSQNKNMLSFFDDISVDIIEGEAKPDIMEKLGCLILAYVYSKIKDDAVTPVNHYSQEAKPEVAVN